MTDLDDYNARLMREGAQAIRASTSAVGLLAARTGCHPLGATVQDLLRKAASGEKVDGLALRYDGGRWLVDVEGGS